jgi:hypothetical protein
METAVTIMALAVVASFGFIVWLIKGNIEAKGNEAGLKTTISSLEGIVADLKKENNALKAENAQLKEKTSPNTHKERLQSLYRFSNHQGIMLKNSDNSPFCPKCFDSLKEIPLKVESDGWRCMVCRQFFYNPDYRSPSQDFGNQTFY